MPFCVSVRLSLGKRRSSTSEKGHGRPLLCRLEFRISRENLSQRQSAKATTARAGGAPWPVAMKQLRLSFAPRPPRNGNSALTTPAPSKKARKRAAPAGQSRERVGQAAHGSFATQTSTSSTARSSGGALASMWMRLGVKVSEKKGSEAGASSTVCRGCRAHDGVTARTQRSDRARAAGGGWFS